MFKSHQSNFRPVLNVERGEESNLNKATRQFFSQHINGVNLIKDKNPKANLRLQNRKVFELSLAATLVVLITGFQIGKQFGFSTELPEKVDLQIEVEDIPITQQFRLPPPPVRPVVPVPTEDESIPEDLTIASTEISLSDIPPPPGPPAEEDGEPPIFFAYDEPPEMIGGLGSLQKHLKYPKLAHAAGVEGVVFVKVLVGVDGSTERTEILQAKPSNMGFEESAQAALKKVKWVPAKQRDRKIRVWVSIPVAFKLVS
ncbi:energy transducer TonB [bacterium]|nr:energy transducer TonB [bacterium]